MTIFVLYFYNEEPGPCKIQTPLIESIELQFKRGVEFKRINVEEEKELTKKYKVEELPTIVIESDGKEKERFVGLTQDLFLKRAIEKNLKECK